MDNDLEITFTPDATFEGAITGVSYNGNALTASQYTVSSGKVTLKPSVEENEYLRTPGTANVVISASGYGNSTVSQTIQAGTVETLEVTTQPVPGTSSGDAFSTQPIVKLKDQYGNYCTTGVSSTANVVATAKSGTGSWSIGGTTTKAAIAGTATFSDLTCTLTTSGNGKVTFTSGIKTIDSSVFTIPQNSAKVLTADTTSNSVDNDLEITFASDATFEGAITGVSYNGNALDASQYTVSSGKVTLKPSVSGNTYLRTPGTGNVVISASGYGNSTVSQTIEHGAVAKMVVDQNITAPANNGGEFVQQPIIMLKDTYDNICTSDSTTVVTAAKEDGGTWTLTGTATATVTGGIATFTDLGATNATRVSNAQIGFTATGLAKVTSATVTLPSTTPPSGSGGGGGSSTTAPTGSVNIVVNGETISAGTELHSTENGKLAVNVTVNNKVIQSKIDEAVRNNKTGQQNVFQVPVADTRSDIVNFELTGDIVKQLETNTFDVSIKHNGLEYTIPTKELTISNAAKELGIEETSLGDIKIEVKIAKLDDSVVAKYNKVATKNGATILFPPTAFEIVAKTTNSEGKTEYVNIGKFSNYVERVMEIPADVDPSKITTGIVFNEDGTYSHVPTEIFQKEGKWYAKLKSLTNSNYSVISNPITVESVEKHWSKDVVNDMASRLVIFNPETFEPDKAITRADFAEYIVRALGIYREGSQHENEFKDVSAKGDRTIAILIANEYEIVAGYPDGTFRPDAIITREEAMAMYQRAMNITKLEGTDTNRYKSYSDYNQVGSWAKTYVQAVLSANVLNGTTPTTISPKSNLTYAEAAQAIKNLLVESKLVNR
ncbi:hemoblobin-interacting domain-containing protein [Andreesenia angusta]|uniref:hemoblobin-interacting domain-containing protein n=1 Tax=Andreesenia angusta TaxID=39480 RepID=UPI001471CB2C|nr:S-layer homology domain-containing protein [Andreesenia angusta]